MSETIRTFIAVELSDELRRSAVELLRKLQATGAM